jgi:hypothetical protein
VPDDDLSQFFRVHQLEDGWAFDVGVVQWPSPYSPELKWCQFRLWSRKPDAARIARAQAAALRQPRFFRRCTTCNELHNAGHMHGPDLCQSCATEKLGVVY